MQTTLKREIDAGRDGAPFRAAGAHGPAPRDRGRHPLPPRRRHRPRQRHPGALGPRQPTPGSARSSRNAAGVSIGTVEHLMAALAGTGITHARSTSTGRRCRSWTAARCASSARSSRRPRARCRAARARSACWSRSATCRATWSAELAPAETLSIDFEIDFADAAIGQQARRLDDGERRLRARARRLPHLLPPRRGRGDAARPAWRSAARSTTPSWSRATGC